MCAAADIFGGLKGSFQSSLVEMEHFVLCDQRHQLVVCTLFLYSASCFHGKLADSLMQLLSVTACLYCVHHDIFGRHKRQLAAQALLNYFRIYNQTVYDVHAKIQNAVNRKEAFRNGNSLVRRIVQRALKPLGSRCDRRI